MGGIPKQKQKKKNSSAKQLVFKREGRADLPRQRELPRTQNTRIMENNLNKILLTGGTGTVGKSFIKNYINKYNFYNISRGGQPLVELIREFPDVTNFMGDLSDSFFLNKVFKKVKPDIVIHLSALKHVDLAEENPTKACEANVIASLNVVRASLDNNISKTIGISTDKACAPENVYGYTKSLMEKCFLDADNPENKFAVCRFANVAHSSGSVIPYWLSLKEKGEALRITDVDMNRLMFSREESSKLIHKSILLCEKEGGFIISRKMKAVNMLDLAKCISKKIKTVGKRPGEKLNEGLISSKEIPYVYSDGDYLLIKNKINPKNSPLDEEYSSLTSERMSNEEIRSLIYENIPR